MSKQVKRICKNCKKEFIADAYRNREFCSKECKGKQVKQICENCKQEYLVYAYKNQRFCSAKCAKMFLKGDKHPNWKNIPPKICKVCGKQFSSKQRKRKCCSWKCGCAYKSQTQQGKNNPYWKGGRHIDQDGYVRIRVYENGKSFEKAEHRIVMEEYIGRKLSSFEIVHHRNGIRDDNHISNLKIVSHSTHCHQVICPHCNFIFALH